MKSIKLAVLVAVMAFAVNAAAKHPPATDGSAPDKGATKSIAGKKGNGGQGGVGGVGGQGGVGGVGQGGQGGVGQGGNSSANGGQASANGGQGGNGQGGNGGNQSQSQQQSNSNSNNSSGNTVTQNYQAQQRDPVASAFAAPLTSSNDTCMGSSSVGGQGVSFGFSAGSTWTDTNCVMLKNAREMHNMGWKEAAFARMCMDDKNALAFKQAGLKCPVAEEKSAAAKPATLKSSDGTFVKAGQIK